MIGEPFGQELIVLLDHEAGAKAGVFVALNSIIIIIVVDGVGIEMVTATCIVR